MGDDLRESFARPETAHALRNAPADAAIDRGRDSKFFSDLSEFKSRIP